LTLLCRIARLKWWRFWGGLDCQLFLAWLGPASGFRLEPAHHYGKDGINILQASDDDETIDSEEDTIPVHKHSTAAKAIDKKKAPIVIVDSDDRSVYL